MSGNFLENLTAMIITYNEAPNIERTLSKLGRVRRIVVIDSGSDDGTQEIVAATANAEIVARPFDTFAAQCNFGLDRLGGDTDWVLSLDADFVLGDGLVDELASLSPRGDVSGYRTRFRYCIVGRPIRSGVYPPLVTLFRRRSARYKQEGHSHKVVVDGRIEDLSGFVLHDDRKPLSRWLDAQKSYAGQEADRLVRGDEAGLRWQDRLRKLLVVAPPSMFFYVLLARGGVFDGWRGLYYALQRSYAELILSLELLDRKLRRRRDG